MNSGNVIGIARRKDGTALVHVEGSGSAAGQSTAVRCMELKKIITLDVQIRWDDEHVFVEVLNRRTERADIHQLHRLPE